MEPRGERLLVGDKGNPEGEATMTLSAQDMCAIQQLAAGYNFAIDFGDPDVWSRCFTDDGVFRSRHGIFKGREELRVFAQRFVDSRKQLRHCVSNLLITGNDTLATMQCYLVLYDVSSDKPLAIATGVYRDKLTKDSGSWKFTERNITLDWAPEGSEPVKK